MGLRLKFNLILVPVAIVLAVISIMATGHAAHRWARAQARQEAALLTAASTASGRYTAETVAPLLASNGTSRLVFVPASAPFYAVDAQARMIEAAVAGVKLRRVVLDSAGASERPDDWERATIDSMRAQPDPHPVEVERTSGVLTLATPLVFLPGICPTCYTSRASAPAGILDAFGTLPGFDRKPGEIVGATVASVPIASAGGGAGWIVALAVLLVVVANLLLETLVLRPLARIRAVADDVSLGKADVAEFGPIAADEIGALTRSFNRLRRSMESAIGLIGT